MPPLIPYHVSAGSNPVVKWVIALLPLTTLFSRFLRRALTYHLSGSEVPLLPNSWNPRRVDASASVNGTP